MPGKKRGYHILVIEDNPGDFALVEDFLLEQFGSPVITHAEDFKKAKKILIDDTIFDSILLDLSLPDKQGEALILEIVEMSLSTPVIVLTGYADFEFGIRSLSLGISDYILKEELTAISLHKSIIYSSERKKGITALEESEKRYSELFHLSPLPMWVVDLNSLRFIDVNKATIDHYGYTREEFLQMILKDIRPVEELPELERGIAEGEKSPGLLSNNIVIHKKKNGELRNVEIQITPFQFKGTTANIVIATDITDRLKYIKAIEEQNEKLKDIAWMQSHVVRAPLARIMGLVQMIKDFEHDPVETGKIFDYIILSANELDEVIKDISDKTYTVNY